MHSLDLLLFMCLVLAYLIFSVGCRDFLNWFTNFCIFVCILNVHFSSLHFTVCSISRQH